MSKWVPRRLALNPVRIDATRHGEILAEVAEALYWHCYQLQSASIQCQPHRIDSFDQGKNKRKEDQR